MERLVEAIVEDPRGEEVDLPGLAERAARATLIRLGLDPDSRDISLLACDDTRIAALNQAFRGRTGATNVLSWPSEDRAGAGRYRDFLGQLPARGGGGGAAAGSPRDPSSGARNAAPVGL